MKILPVYVTKITIFYVFLFLSTHSCPALCTQNNGYIPIAGLFDLRSTFSDGTHSIDDLAKMARSRGFKCLFLNDHDRIALSYGIYPFKNIFRYKKEYPSIITHGPEKYLDEINRVSAKYPDMIIIPGCETSAYYYWTGSWFKKSLTLNNYDRRMLIVNLTEPGDYQYIPNLPYKFSFRYTSKLLPGLLVFVILLAIGMILIRWKGLSRLMGIFIIIFSSLTIIDYNPFRSSLFSPYETDAGIAPYQELIDYVNEKGALSFWNYPEQKSGTRTQGPIEVRTPPYPQVLHESVGYTGFAAIYGEYTTATVPGGEWDMVLNEYCRGQRDNAPWAISAADFHEEGFLNQVLGSFPTIFLIKEFSKEGVLESIRNGLMYCSRGDGREWPQINYFVISGKDDEKAFMGETLTTFDFPAIRFEVSYNDDASKKINIDLIRGGKLIRTFAGTTPLRIEYRDDDIHTGAKTYYRIMDQREHLVSNPIFVIRKSSN
jgi:hypothetical protein